MDNVTLYIVIIVILVVICCALLKIIPFLHACCCWAHLNHNDELNTPFVTSPEESSPSSHRRHQRVYRVENERSRPRPRRNVANNESGESENDRLSPTVFPLQQDTRRKRQPVIYSAVTPPLTYHISPKNDHVNETIFALQEKLRQEGDPVEIISTVQLLLLSFPDADDSVLYSDDEQCPLLIATDATPGTLAGYCVNLKQKRLNFYVIKRKDVPWTLNDPKDPSEFEMKNFMFALTVWSEQICCLKKMCIYTDNFAITKISNFDDNLYGDKAFQVLQHFINCKGVCVMNVHSMAVNRFKNLRNFAKYIQPADDLSRWNIGKAVEFLVKIYGIEQENVSGTHCIDQKNENYHRGKTWYKPSNEYQQIIRNVTDKLDQNCSSPSCHGLNPLHASIKTV